MHKIITLYGQRVAMIMLALNCITVFADPTAIRFENGWAREAPPGIRILAAYGNLINLDNKAYILSGIDSPQFERVEIHKTVIDNDVARMEMLNNLQIEARDTIQLKQGGLHLMLINPHEAMQTGDSVDLLFKFQNSEPLESSIPVQRQIGADDIHHHHSHHH